MEMETINFDKMIDVVITNEEEGVSNKEIENINQTMEIQKDENNKNKEFIEEPIGVYVKYDENGNITEVNSDIFIRDFTGWTKIDAGYGDRYAHAQNQYFERKDEN